MSRRLGCGTVGLFQVANEEEPCRIDNDGWETDRLMGRLALVDGQAGFDVSRLGRRLRNTLEWRYERALRREICSATVARWDQQDRTHGDVAAMEQCHVEIRGGLEYLENTEMS